MSIERINVICLAGPSGPVDETCRELILKVSPRVSLTDITALAQAERSGDSAAKAKLDAILAEAEIMFGGQRALVDRAPN